MENDPTLLDEWVRWSFAQYGNGKDALTRHQMKLAVISLTGKKPTDLPRGQNSFSINDLADYVTILTKGSIIGDISSLYDAFDQDGKGYVTLPDMIDAAKTYNTNISEQIIEDAFNRVDRDHDGRISYREFMSTIDTGLIELGVRPTA